MYSATGISILEITGYRTGLIWVSKNKKKGLTHD